MYRQIFFNLFLVFLLLQVYVRVQYLPIAHALFIGVNAFACVFLFAKPLRQFSFANFALLPGFIWGSSLFYTVQQERDEVSQTVIGLVTVVWAGIAVLGPYYRELFSLGRDEDT